MADDRPRPQYGEYATPQEQAEIAARLMPPVSPLLKPNDQHGAVAPGTADPGAERHLTGQPLSGQPRPGEPAHHVGSAWPSSSAGSLAPGQKAPRRWDRILSMALLGYGLFTVIAGLFQYADLASSIQQVYDSQGIGTFTATTAVSTVSVVIRVGIAALWAVTALLTVRVLRTGRLAFYIPIIGGAIAGLGTFVLLAVVLASDPGFLDYVQGMQP